MRFLDWAEKLSSRTKILLTLLLLLLIGIIDMMTGYELSFSLFYLAPVALATWGISTRFGLVVVTFSAVVWFWADIAGGQVYSNPLFNVWNTGTRLGIFVIVAILLSRLQQALETEQKLARSDHLTQAYNRRYFLEIMTKEVLRAQRYGHPLSLVYLDLDNFKQVNDRLGHAAGDALLQRVVRTLQENLRALDIVGRLGGDEFVILLPETNGKTAKVTITRIVSQLCRVNQVEAPIVTFSIGVISCDTHIPENAELVKLADAAMYEAKSAGKNQIVFAVHTARSGAQE